MMRHDGGDPLKSQDHHAGLRALPLKAMECDKFDGGGHRLLRSWQGGTLSTSVEEVYGHDKKADKYY
jgi:hypothetical protein